MVPDAGDLRAGCRAVSLPKVRWGEGWECALHDGVEGRDLIGDADPCNLDNVMGRDMNSLY
jgi:hypothetical protein